MKMFVFGYGGKEEPTMAKMRPEYEIVNQT